MNYGFGENRKHILKEDLSSVDKIKDCLYDLCDTDYNGTNGKDYFKTITKEVYDELKSHNLDVDYSYERYSVSNLDYMWYKLTKDKTESEIINNAASIMQDILQDNYEFGDYVFGIAEVVDTPTKIVVVIAYATYD